MEIDRKVCTLHPDMIKALVRQVGIELSNKYFYKAFANYFGTNGLFNLEEYFEKRATEEELHHKWISDYLSFNDAEFQYPEIPKTDIKIDNNLTPFTATVDREINTTMEINKLIELALEQKDWATFSWLTGDSDEKGRLCLEQIEEESISRSILDLASEANTSWLIKQEAIMDFYEATRG
jgi:ferritin